MIVFSHIEKTAGTSFKTLLRCNMGLGMVETNKTKHGLFDRNDLAFAKRVFPEVRALAGHNLSDPMQNLGEEHMELITFLRDPLQRCASHYQDKVLRNGLQESFETWISEPRYQNFMIRSLSGREDLELAKRILKEDYAFVGLTEQFEDSLRMLKLVLKMPLKLQYRTSIVAGSNRVKKQVLDDPQSRELLIRHNALDQELYDWAKRELFEPMKARLAPQMVQIRVNSKGMSLGDYLRLRAAILYNKFVYRQVIKLRRS